MYRRSPVAPLGRSAKALFPENASSGASANESGPFRPATPAEANAETPRPAQRSPSFAPEG